MSSPFPLLTDWLQDGRKWKYVFSPNFSSKNIPAGGELRLPYQNHVYTHEEMVIMVMGAAFDNALCGIKIKTDPNFDSGTIFTVFNMAFGGITLPETLIYVRLPPDTAPGVFAMRIPSFWLCMNSLELSLINTDTVAHNSLGVAYILAVTDDKRKVN